MPKIKNKVTEKEKTVTDEQLKTILDNPMTSKLYTVINTTEPAEVTAAKNANANKAAKQ